MYSQIIVTFVFLISAYNSLIYNNLYIAAYNTYSVYHADDQSKIIKYLFGTFPDSS